MLFSRVGVRTHSTNRRSTLQPVAFISPARPSLSRVSGNESFGGSPLHSRSSGRRIIESGRRTPTTTLFDASSPPSPRPSLPSFFPFLPSFSPEFLPVLPTTTRQAPAQPLFFSTSFFPATITHTRSRTCFFSNESSLRTSRTRSISTFGRAWCTSRRFI